MFSSNKHLVFVIGMIFSITTYAQNLVLNPSFETVNTGNLECSWYTTQAQFANAITNWTVPTGGSTDIFHTSLATSCYCSPFSTNASSPGQQTPRTGNAFVNIVTHGSGGCTPYREYIQGQLCTPLAVGVTYEVEMYVSLADNMNKGTNNIGVKFSTAPYNSGSMCVYNTVPDLNYTGPIIMDKLNWTQILFTYTPTAAGLQNFIIGNFYSDANTATQSAPTGSGATIRYFIDDVRISVINPPTAGTNGTLGICPGESPVNLFSLLGGNPTAGGTWSGPSTLLGGHLGTFNPSVNTPGTYTYSVNQAGSCTPTVVTATVIVTNNGQSNATINTAGPFCLNDAAVQLNAASGGGTWSGTGITNTTNGIFDPSVAGVGTHTITYTIAGSCGNTDTEQITVSPAQDASISNAGPFCVDAGVVQLTSLNAGGTWSGTGITNTANGTFDPSVAGVGTHLISYALSGNCGDTESISIVVNSISDASISPVAALCANAGSIQLSAAELGGTWSGTGITNATNGTFDPSIAGVGIHTINYTIAGSCGNTDTEQITIDPVQDASISNAGPFCVDAGVVQLTSLNAGGTWSGTGITNATNGTFDPSVAGVGTHVITYALSGNCGDTESISIVVNSISDASISPVAALCANAGSIQLIAAELGGTWSGTGITNATNGTFDPSVAGVGIHTITYTITGSCGNSDTEQITIDPVQDASISNAGPFCVDAGVVQLTSLNAGGSWSGTGITNTVNGTFDPSAAGVGTHVITYTLLGNCGDTESISIVVLDRPTPTFVATPIEGCAPLLVEFENTTIIGATATVVWNFGDGSSSSASGFVNHIYTVANCYDVSLSITENGCTNTLTVPSQVCVHENAVAEFEMSSTSSGSEINYSFFNLSQNATDYLWNFGDQTTSNAFEGEHTYPLSAGNYTICLEALTIHGCNDEVCQEIVVEDELIYYVPNTFTPDGDKYNQLFLPVFTSGFDMYDFSFYIFDRWGEMIWESHNASVGWDGTYNGTLSPDGMYTWKVEFKTSRSDERIVEVGHVNLMR